MDQKNSATPSFKTGGELIRQHRWLLGSRLRKSSDGQELSNYLIAYLRPLIVKMARSSIVIDVELDAQKVPTNIEWKATDSTIEKPQQAKAFILSLWDGADKTALRIDLWTEKMMIDEMADFYYQTLVTMADTLGRATKQQALVTDMKNFAESFYQKFQKEQMKENKLEQ